MAQAQSDLFLRAQSEVAVFSLRARAFIVVSIAVTLLACTQLKERDTDQGCATCHGTDPSTPAPAPDLDGSTATTSRGVGAHAQHLSPALSSPVACATCHVVPVAATDPGHLDTTLEERGTPADVTFSGIAITGASAPTHDEGALTCGSTWCHSRPGAAFPTPVWTQVDGTQITCDGCHGQPPPVPHPQREDCAACHSDASASGGIANPALHVNGVVDVELDTLACDDCHGSDPDAPAPPPDLAGNTDTSARGVGAHATHLAGGLASRAVECDECHLVPTLPSDPGHLDAALPADVQFDDLGSADDAEPVFDETALTCSGSYCHGATLAGGSLTAPTWTTVNNTQNACGTCHGLPPSAPHPQLTSCLDCHPDAGAGPAIVDSSLHVNGVVEVIDLDTLACNACHGTDASKPAPPPALDGSTATTAAGVGAHETHLNTTTSVPVACAACHNVPTTVSAAGHLDSALPADVQFPAGGIASTNHANPTYDPSTLTCTNVYCHGGGTKMTAAGGAAKSPIWNVVDNTYKTCGTCHAVPPDNHPPSFSTCSDCHPTTALGVNVPDPAFHIDGVIDTTW